MHQAGTLWLPTCARIFVVLSNAPTKLVRGQVRRSILSSRKSSRDGSLPGSLQPCSTRWRPDLVAIR